MGRRFRNQKGESGMKCFLCKGELQEATTNFMIDVDNCFIIVKNVPSQVCSQCGEVSYSDEVAARLERIVKAVRKAVSEVAIVNYQDSVA
jgi:YgiT-type zinc finger domain-containing protein